MHSHDTDVVLQTQRTSCTADVVCNTDVVELMFELSKDVVEGCVV